MTEEYESGNFAYGLKSTGRKTRGLPGWKKGKVTSPLKCPSCAWRTSAVIDSRPRGEYRYRRRACPECGTLFSTREYAEENPLGPARPFPDWKHDTILAEWRLNVAQVIDGTTL